MLFVIKSRVMKRGNKLITFKEIQDDLKLRDLGKFLALELISEIAIIRNEKGITQKSLSEISGVPQKTISRLENGKDIPTLDTIGKLLKGLGYTAKITLEENQD